MLIALLTDKSGTDSSIHQRPDLSRPGSGFSPFEEAKRTSYTVDDLRLSLDRPAVSLGLDGSTPDNVLDTNNPSLNSKGSRFAKFFDGKGKETNTPVGKSPVAPPPPSSLRQEPNHPANAERSLEDIFAMLSSSAQVSVSPTNYYSLLIFYAAARSPSKYRPHCVHTTSAN